MEKDQVIQQAFGSVKWSAMSSFLPRLITPLSAILLAKLLTPEDFGTVAASILVITLARIVVGLGMGAAVIQRRTFVEEAASLALFFSFLIALLLYLILWIASPYIAQLYSNPYLTNVIKVSGIALILNALLSIPRALLKREMQFKKLFWVGVIPPITTAIISVILALLGTGYWSLVWGSLSGLFIHVALIWHLCSWRPRFIFDLELVKSLFSFSLWIMFSGFLSWSFLYADNAIAGIFFGADGLGEYSLGFNLANLLPGMIMAVIVSVAYPAFCALQDKPAVFKHSLLETQSLAATLVFPLGFGISALAAPVVFLMYGKNWPNLGWIMAWLVIMPGLSHLWSLNAEAFRAVGQPGAWAKAAFASLLLMIPFLFFAGTQGLFTFVVARFMGSILYTIIIIFVGTKTLGLGVINQIRGLIVPAFCGSIMYAFLIPLRDRFYPYQGVSGWMKVILITIFGFIIYTFLLWLIKRDLLKKILTTSKRVIWSA